MVLDVHRGTGSTGCPRQLASTISTNSLKRSMPLLTMKLLTSTQKRILQFQSRTCLSSEIGSWGGSKEYETTYKRLMSRPYILARRSRRCKCIMSSWVNWRPLLFLINDRDWNYDHGVVWKIINGRVPSRSMSLDQIFTLINLELA